MLLEEGSERCSPTHPTEDGDEVEAGIRHELSSLEVRRAAEESRERALCEQISSLKSQLRVQKERERRAYVEALARQMQLESEAKIQ